MISQLLPPLSSMLATKLLAGFGTAAVASWALGSRYEFFAIVSVLALTMSMPPMVGRLLERKTTPTFSLSSRLRLSSYLVSNC